MYYNKKIISAKFSKRPNRFQGYVILNNEEILVHVPNTGRCKEILVPGVEVLLREENGENRKTKYDLIAAYKNNNKLISIDSHIPNKVVDEALKNRKIAKLTEYNIIMREKTFGNSRFDFKLMNEAGDEYFLEVKGVTLEENKIARFPDAPTERGRKHVLELIEAKKQGKGSGILFLIQLDCVEKFTTNDITDPKFGDAVREAQKSGVDLFAYSCKVNRNEIEILKEIKIEL